MENDVKPQVRHKLCGYLRTVLSVPDGAPPITLNPLNCLCRIASEPPNSHFVAPNGVVLSTIGGGQGSGTGKGWSKIGMEQGSISVVQQLHALVIHKCVSIVARIVNVCPREDEVGEIRVVVLVDVYLPIAVWSGWQFPRSKSTAAALFKHLSFDWEARSSMLGYLKLDSDDYSNIWNVTDCHVLGCKHHCTAPDNPKKKPFELQEIFRTLPCATKKIDHDGTRVNPSRSSNDSGIWDLSDDLLITILVPLCPVDLLSISLTCRHLRFLAASIMPCMKLKLYPHQQSAVEWILCRERESQVLQHPLYMDFKTEDEFDFCINVVSGEIISGVAPTIKYFHGGMFCDEPGLGKTITSLSLILKTQGTLAETPNGVPVIWCIHDGNRMCGYYEANRDNIKKSGILCTNKNAGDKAKRGKLSLEEVTPKKNSISSSSGTNTSLCSGEQIMESCSSKRIKLSNSPLTHEKKKEKKSEERVNLLRQKSSSLIKKKDKELIKENLEYNET